jgi:hypothetical protein
MKITKSQLKQVIKEEFSTLKEGYESYKVGDLINLLAEADPEAGLAIRHRHAADPFEIYEAYTTRDGQVIITVQERE